MVLLLIKDNERVRKSKENFMLNSLKSKDWVLILWLKF